MSRTIINLPNLPQYFLNTKEFIEYIKPQYFTNFNRLNKLSTDFQDSAAIFNFMFINRGWRLSRKGNTFLSNYYKSYRSKHENNFEVTGKLLLQMNKIINGPWYLEDDTVIIWNSTIHFELQLVDGKLSDLLEFKSI